MIPIPLQVPDDSVPALVIEFPHDIGTLSGQVIFIYADQGIPNDGYKSLRFPSGTLVGVNEQPSVTDNLLQLQAVPNPGNGQLIFRWNNPELKPVYIRITDLSGKQVFSATIPATTYTWQTATYPRGVYYLEVSVESRRQTLQLHLP